MSIEKVKLKGGSLSGTYIIKDNGFEYVRKEISLIKNREYGFQRWYSQLKKIQRYSVLFPDVFPKLLGYGMNRDIAYFNIEYIKDSLNGFEFLTSNTNKVKINNFIKALKNTMDSMYSLKMTSDVKSMELYLNEEVDQRLLDCQSNDKFKKFLNYKTIIFQNEEIPSFITQLDKYKSIALKYYKTPFETFTHGNLTLENILYCPNNNKVYFIDPYEENIIDSPLAEYSQLLQSSNSLYELYNSNTPTVNINKINIKVSIPMGLSYFNSELNKLIQNNFNSNDIKIIKVLEISQFIRMLPFKAVVDEDKMIFFYALASKLLNDLVNIK